MLGPADDVIGCAKLELAFAELFFLWVFFRRKIDSIASGHIVKACTLACFHVVVMGIIMGLLSSLVIEVLAVHFFLGCTADLDPFPRKCRRTIRSHVSIRIKMFCSAEFFQTLAMFKSAFAFFYMFNG